jgi:hypothetical protein
MEIGGAELPDAAFIVGGAFQVLRKTGATYKSRPECSVA